MSMKTFRLSLPVTKKRGKGNFMKIELIEKLSLNDEPTKKVVLDRFISIPYITEFRKLELVNNINTCLLMGRFEQLFSQYPDGFYKYKQPCEWQANLKGLSWREELGMTRTVLDISFRAIVHLYKSKGEFERAKDKFQGKYYCGYVEYQNYNKTFYLRNNELLDKCLGQLLAKRNAK
jgi:hypothetical protein